MSSLCVPDIFFEVMYAAVFSPVRFSFILIIFSSVLGLYPGPTWKEDVRLGQLTFCTRPADGSAC